MSVTFLTNEDRIDMENSILESTDNMLNPVELVSGLCVNRNTGNYVVNAVYDTYANIPVESSTEYILQRSNSTYFSIIYTFYDSDGSFLSGSILNKSNTTFGTFITPEKAAYVSISYATGNSSGEVYAWNDIMLSKGKVVKTYKPYKIFNTSYNYNLYKEIETLNNFSQICYGGERLYSWYKKIIDGESVRVTLMGDSTMAETYFTDEHPNQQKAYYIRKMIENAIGADRLTVVNWGVGSTSTGDLVGSHFSTDIIATNFPNGYMATRISEDTDLLIINYGINDYSYNADTLSYEERLNAFRDNYTEFFKRLFGSNTVNGRSYLNRSLDDISVIVMVPNIVATDEERKQWAFDCRTVLQELTKEYPFALFDTLKVNGDHDFSSAWSIGDNTHPNYYVNAYAMQFLKPLIIPEGIA